MTIKKLKAMWPGVSIYQGGQTIGKRFTLHADINGHTVTARKADATCWWSRIGAACSALDWELGYVRGLLNFHKEAKP